MRKKFDRRIPQKPLLKVRSYIVPGSYGDLYEQEGVRDPNHQAVLYHLTQFGGFRVRNLPRWFNPNVEFKEGWYVHRKEGPYHTYRAGPKFLRTFGDLKIEPLQRIWRRSVLSEKDMVECGHSQEEIDDVRNFLEELNEFYSAIRLGIEPPNSGISSEDRVQLSRLHGIPFLAVKPFTGGRFFHPEVSYQRISSTLRPLITLNGERTTEIDLSAATLQFMDIILERQGTGPIRDSILRPSDPYQYFLSRFNSSANRNGGSPRKIGREEMKKLLYTLIYSPENRQESNLNHYLSRAKIDARYSDFVHLFGEFFSALFSLRALAGGKPLHRVINKEESSYAREVLERGCLEGGIPILPIHDSFITVRRYREDLERILNESARARYSRKLRYKVKY